MADKKFESVSEFIRAETQRIGSATMAPGSQAFKEFQAHIIKRIFVDEKFVSAVERYYEGNEALRELQASATARSAEVDARRVAHPVRAALHLHGRPSSTLVKVEEQATAAWRQAEVAERHQGIAWDAVKTQVTRLIGESVLKIALTLPSAQTAAQAAAGNLLHDHLLNLSKKVASGLSR